MTPDTYLAVLAMKHNEDVMKLRWKSALKSGSDVQYHTNALNKTYKVVMYQSLMIFAISTILLHRECRLTSVSPSKYKMHHECAG